MKMTATEEQTGVETGRIVITRRVVDGDDRIAVNEAVDADGNPMPLGEVLVLLRLAEDWFLYGPRDS